MPKTINFGIGFVTGRPNVCDIINNYYKNILEQINTLDKDVRLTILILYDLEYQQTQRSDFYNLTPEVYEKLNIKYITPEDIEEEKKILIGRNNNLSKDDLDAFLGYGHAKGRNTVMYFAKKRNLDYLLFWDDDEYPVACTKDENNQVNWVLQNNVSEHLKYIDNANITIGHHCGYISPIPYVELSEDIDESLFKKYIESVSNDIISWESIKEKFTKHNGVTFANKQIIDESISSEIKYDGVGKWVAGSTICLNLRKIDQIPAYYNPPGARGEDTFFSTMLEHSRVLRIPFYHFHDGFLKYKSILKDNFPKTLRKIKVDEELIPQRFLNASRGWIKYKPLLLYIQDKENYANNIKDVKEKLKISIPEVNKLFPGYDMTILTKDLDTFSKNVEVHYQEYLKINEIWNTLKNAII